MRHTHWRSALVYTGTGTMAALIPGLFVLRMHGHHLYGLAHGLMPGLVG